MITATPLNSCAKHNTPRSGLSSSDIDDRKEKNNRYFSVRCSTLIAPQVGKNKQSSWVKASLEIIEAYHLSYML